MRIYTRTGDRGTTGLFGGDRVPKSHPRIRAYGTVDELNATLGVVAASLGLEPALAPLPPVLVRLQHELFVLGADLATPLDARAVVTRVDDERIAGLEGLIDQFDADLPPLRFFILPGGALPAASLHVARTVCRRAEREVVEALATEALNERVVVYLNRLSDLLFVLARWVNQQSGVEEPVWNPDAPPTD